MFPRLPLFRSGKALKRLLAPLALMLAAAPAWAQVDTYGFTPSTGTYTQLPATATPLTSIQGDDLLSAPINIGFPFTFDGTPNNMQVRASSNGWLTFNLTGVNTALQDRTNDLDNGPAVQRPLVAPFWDDLNGATGTALYQTTGTAPNRVFTFEWRNWYRFGQTGPAFSMQVQLFETTNVVRFVYRQESAPLGTGATASVGLSGVGTGANSFLSLNNVSTSPTVSSLTETDNIAVLPATGQLYTFTPPAPSACPTPRNLTATVTGQTSATLNWTVVGGGGTFSVVYDPAGFTYPSGGTTVANLSAPTTTLSNLAPGTYQFYVVQNCSGAAGNSNASNPGSFTIACPTPTGVTVTNLTNTTATVTWSSPVTTNTTFTVIYGPPGFSPTATAPPVVRATGITTTSYQLTNLLANTSYEVYVLQNCLGGATSVSPAGPIAFSTPLLPPSNDDPCGAIALGTATLSSSNVGATTSLQPGIQTPGCAPATRPQDVWYTVTPTNSGLTLTLSGTAAGQVRLYAAPSCSAGPFTLVGCQAAGGNATGFTQPVVFPGLTPGTQYYLAISGFGSIDPQGAFTLTAGPLSTRSQALAQALQVFPSPSPDHQLTLRLPLAPAGTAQLCVLNALGQRLLQRPLLVGAAGLDHTLDLRQLPAGVYSLQLLVDQHLLTQKIVLQ